MKFVTQYRQVRIKTIRIKTIFGKNFVGILLKFIFPYEGSYEKRQENEHLTLMHSQTVKWSFSLDCYYLEYFALKKIKLAHTS